MEMKFKRITVADAFSKGTKEHYQARNPRAQEDEEGELHSVNNIWTMGASMYEIASYDHPEPVSQIFKFPYDEKDRHGYKQVYNVDDCDRGGYNCVPDDSLFQRVADDSDDFDMLWRYTDEQMQYHGFEPYGGES